jgi:hypothetical protein
VPCGNGGEFSIQFGSGAMVSTDSSIAVANEMGGFGMSSGITSGVNSQQVNEQDVKQCEIIAVLRSTRSRRPTRCSRPF